MVRVKNPIITRIAGPAIQFVLHGKRQVLGYFGWCLILKMVLSKLRGKILIVEDTQVGLLSQRKELCSLLSSECKMYTRLQRHMIQYVSLSC